MGTTTNDANGGEDEFPHVVLHPFGDVDAYSQGVLRQSWDDVQTGENVIVVLNDVPFMDSAGLGALIAGLKRTRDAGGVVGLAAAKPALARVLRTVGLDRIMPIRETYEDALAALEDLGG